MTLTPINKSSYCSHDKLDSYQNDNLVLSLQNDSDGVQTHELVGPRHSTPLSETGADNPLVKALAYKSSFFSIILVLGRARIVLKI